MTSQRLRFAGPRDRNARLAMLGGWWDRSVVKAARVGVIGIGALGNEILKNLALLDFRSVVLIDKDIVEISNLSRSVLFRSSDEGKPKVEAAVGAAAALNPDLSAEPLAGDVMSEVGLGWLRHLDVLIAGLDSRHVRWWLNRSARALGIPWVEGATEGSHGHAVAFLPEGPCYECTFTDLDWRALEQVASCRQLQLDAAAQGRVATSPTMASIIGAAQVHLAMDVLHGRSVQSGRSLLFNLSAPELMVSGRRENPSCDAHYRWDPILPSELSADRSTVAQVLAVAAEHVGEPATLELRWDLVWEFSCHRCGDTRAVRRPRDLVRYSEASCPKCGAEVAPTFVHRLSDQAHGALLLRDVGIPRFDIVEVRGPEDTVWIELTGDAPEGRGETGVLRT